MRTRAEEIDDDDIDEKMENEQRRYEERIARQQQRRRERQDDEDEDGEKEAAEVCQPKQEIEEAAWDEEAYQRQDDIDREEALKPRKRKRSTKEENERKHLGLYKKEGTRLYKAIQQELKLLPYCRLIGKEIINKWYVKRECWLTNEQLAEAVGCSAFTVNQSIKALKESQWIRTKKYKNYNEKLSRRFYWTRKITMGKKALKIAVIEDKD